MIRLWLVFSPFICILISQISCKILRAGKYRFEGNFSVVTGNTRVKFNCIRNITKTDTLTDCTRECLLEPKCKSFNRHEIEGACELLEISKFDVKGAIKSEKNWVHYDTDYDAKEIGSVCRELKPCKSFEVCESTLGDDPAYQCKCRDDFNGTNCTKYIGPGTKEKSAPSCRLLFEKSKFIPDDDYLIEGKSELQRCVRRVDGRYTAWSEYDECTKEGIQTSNRTCTNPPPKGGGEPCAGPSKRTRKCLFMTSFGQRPVTLYSHKEEIIVKKNNLLTNLTEPLARQYRIFMEVKMNNNMPHWESFFLLKFDEFQASPHMDSHEISLGLLPPFTLVFEPSPYTFGEIKYHFENFFTIGNWITLELKKEMVGEEFIFEIYKDGEGLHSMKNKWAHRYKNVQVYASDNADDTAIAGEISIRNLLIQVKKKKDRP